MNWSRLLRALEAGEIERVEERRSDMLTGEIEKEQLRASEWEAIRAHDQWVTDGNGDEQT